jgi:hypothetical protein
MKKLYPAFYLSLFLLVSLLYNQQVYAQCVNGAAAGTAVYDTTIRFASGVTHKQIRFPKFNAQTGMLTCVKLIVTMTGVIDTTAFENLSDAPITVTRNYNRSDGMSGPGLTPSMSNNFNGTSNFPLGTNDYITHAGQDFYSSARDTIMRQQMVRTLTDSTAISAFYGTDSVVYDYDINVVSTVTAGGDIDNYMRTSAYVNFRFEYCTCPIATLPLGLKNFSVAKTGNSNAGLNWEAEAGKDHYFYEVEVSRDGSNFVKTAIMDKSTVALAYQYGYSIKSNEYGRYYFRVKQQWIDGYFRYSEVRTVDFANPLFSTVSLYPNPSTGAVGIKFVAAKAGMYSVKVSNTAGQVVLSKDIQVAETDFRPLAQLQRGTYYVKITEPTTGASCIQQMVVQ